MKKIAFLSIILSLVVFSSCEQTKRVIDTAGSVQLNGSYVITSLDNQNVDKNELTIVFSALDTSVRGNAGCNTFFGDYNLDLYTLQYTFI